MEKTLESIQMPNVVEEAFVISKKIVSGLDKLKSFILNHPDCLILEFSTNSFDGWPIKTLSEFSFLVRIM